MFLRIIFPILVVIGGLISHLLGKNQRVAKKAIFVISLVLLIYKIAEYCYKGLIIHKPVYPVEISHISYFVVGTVGAFGFKKPLFFAGFLSLISGIGYTIGAVVQPYIITETLNTYEMWQGVATHFILFVLGFLILFESGELKIKDWWATLLGLVLLVCYVLLVHYKYIFPKANLKSIIIDKIITGDILAYVMDPSAITPFLRTLILILIVIVFTSLIFVFYYINHRKYVTNIKDASKLGDKNTYGIIPFLVKNYSKKKLNKTNYDF
ncbi:MAG: hypothetical protein IAC78_03750 [Firmicutes bacterium]|uniref:Uncharacterized protein n=1 Tax=Candidatus Scatoplasma merdavium TaxID=2840932 RepID=A0A9D9GRF5_9BACL|nr:hypothetical protein [Candidatus Scatoplasma merdavium]